MLAIQPLTTMKTLETILLIEDDDTINFYNEFVIKEMGVSNDVQIAINGRMALDYLDQRVSAGQPLPELIFLDINMPVMNGFEFIEEYERRGWKEATLIVMLTTSLHPNDVARAKQYESIAEYLHKPLMEDSLKGIVGRYFGE
jgi:CheY-like chemotaxis protein